MIELRKKKLHIFYLLHVKRAKNEKFIIVIEFGYTIN